MQNLIQVIIYEVSLFYSEYKGLGSHSSDKCYVVDVFS